MNTFSILSTLYFKLKLNVRSAKLHTCGSFTGTFFFSSRFTISCLWAWSFLGTGFLNFNEKFLFYCFKCFRFIKLIRQVSELRDLRRIISSIKCFFSNNRKFVTYKISSTNSRKTFLFSVLLKPQLAF